VPFQLYEPAGLDPRHRGRRGIPGGRRTSHPRRGLQKFARRRPPARTGRCRG
jgi:hypothetical protein